VLNVICSTTGSTTWKSLKKHKGTNILIHNTISGVGEMLKNIVLKTGLFYFLVSLIFPVGSS